MNACRPRALLVETVIETVALMDRTDAIEGSNIWNGESAEDLGTCVICVIASAV
jgi:hypothetical protein